MTAPFIDPASIQRQAWGGGYSRGVAYFAQGAVLRLGWDEAARTISGRVRGSGSTPYSCAIKLAARSDRISSTRCSCPMSADCKHVVATLLASNDAAARAGHDKPAIPPAPTAPAPDKAAAPTWRDVVAPPPEARHTTKALALAFEVQARAAQRSTWMPARYQEARPASLGRGGTDLRLAIRPLERSAATGAWIKGGVSWDTLRRPGSGHDERQARWFAQLHNLTREVRSLSLPSDTAEWVVLDTTGSALLWPHLTEALALGIPLVGLHAHTTVALADAADVAVELVPDTGGGLRMRVRTDIAGASPQPGTVRPLGHAGIYAARTDGARIALTLAPAQLSDTAARLLAGTDDVAVPAADVDAFMTQALPRLRRAGDLVAAPGIALPEPEPARLVLEIAHLPGHSLEHLLRWRYGTHNADYAPDASDELRDPDAEARLRSELEATWTAAADIPFAPAGLLHEIDAARFAVHVLPAVREVDGLEVVVTGTAPDYRELTDEPRITVSTVESTDRDWFDLGVIVTIDGRRIPFGALFTALSLRRKNMLLADGGYFSLAHPALQQLRDLIDEAGELVEWEVETIRVNRSQVDFWEEFEDLADESLPAVTWRSLAEGLRDVDSISHTDPPAGLDAQLRPYQQTGYDWLAFLWQHRLGGILADDMGLGKTLQMLAMITHAREAGEKRPFLVVAPTSVLGTWHSEAARFAPGLRVAVIDATTAKRGQRVRDAAAGADIVVTSYTLVRLDEHEYAAVEWAALVLDEAQFVKNPRTKLHRAVKSLRADAVFAITGTPMENSLTELWALLSLCAPGLFASARKFREDYVAPIEQGKVPENEEGSAYRTARLQRLRRRIRPLVLRRTKELVASDLPPKQEQELLVPLRPAHRALYDVTLQRERQKVLGLLDDLDRNRFIVFRSLTLLRMLALSPALIDGAHAGIASAKLDALLEQLPDLAAEGHRALVFSQFTSFLDLAEARLRDAGIPFVRLDGSTRARGAVVDDFRTGDAPVFLISLKAGGFGLTLTEADYVFLLDPWWNPAAEAQAIDRTHRIGQQRNVFVYRLIAEDTIEQKVLELQRRKARLFQSVMDDEALFAEALDADDIRGLFEA